MRQALRGRLGRLTRAEALLWSPAALAAVFLVVFLVRFPALIDRVYWDSDAATAAVFAEVAGHGTIAIDRYGYYPFLLLAALTRSLPFHRQLWEGFPYGFALASVAGLAWVSWRLAGGWAAAMTTTVGVATAPFVSYDRVTLNYHTPTWCAVVVCAVYCSWLGREQPRRRLVAVSVPVALLAGCSLTDSLFVFVGLVPLAVAGAFLIRAGRSAARRLQGVLAIAVAGAALPLAWLTARLASSLGIHVFPRVPLVFAAGNELLSNFGKFLYGILQLANGNQFMGAKLDATSLLSLACAAVMLAALAAPFALLRRELRSDVPNGGVLAVAAFWSACIVAVGAGFVLGDQASGLLSYYYFVPILYAVAATAPLVLAGGTVGRSVAAGGVALVALTSLVNLLGPAERFNGAPPIEAEASRIIAIATRDHALVGYAPYWDASDLAWASRGALQVAPVQSDGGIVVPSYTGNVASAWFTPRREGSFLLEDTTSTLVTGGPPSALGQPSATERLGPDITMWIYPYDISTRITYPATPWSPDPTIATGSGFNATEQYLGAPAHWMIQDGKLIVSSEGLTAVRISAILFSNGRGRTLRVRASDGELLTSLEVPTNATPVTLGPFLLPPGRSTLTLSASPGPALLGPSDPRNASVFVAALDINAACATFVPASGRVVAC